MAKAQFFLFTKLLLPGFKKGESFRGIKSVLLLDDRIKDSLETSKSKIIFKQGRKLHAPDVSGIRV